MNRDIIIFFFFQAEDGIRDKLVTGVQTCALPICGGALAPFAALGAKARLEPRQQRFVDVLARDLSRAGRQAVVMAGPRSSPLVHALAHAMNASLSSDAVRHQKPLLHDA